MDPLGLLIVHFSVCHYCHLLLYPVLVGFMNAVYCEPMLGRFTFVLSIFQTKVMSSVDDENATASNEETVVHDEPPSSK